MKILVLNSGSSSVKYKLIDTDNEKTLAEGGVEKIGLHDGFLKYKRADGSKEYEDTARRGKAAYCNRTRRNDSVCYESRKSSTDGGACGRIVKSIV
jgi:acetate kinase